MMFDDKSKGIAQAYLNMLEAAKPKPAMDPVGNHDADIDNDGDKDKSDSYLIKRRAAISKSVKEEKCAKCGCDKCECMDEASCGTGYPMKSAKKEALEIAPAGKSDVKKKGMVDKDGGDEEEEDDDTEDDNDDDEIEVTIKKKDDKGAKKKETMEKFDPLKHVKNPTPGEKKAAKDVKRSSYADRAAMLRSAQAGGRLKEASAGSAYAIGMDSAMKSTGDNPPLEKSTIKKAHKIAKGIMKKESTVWNWDEILDAPEEDIDALIENLEGEDLETFMDEFNALTESYKEAPPNETTVKTGKEDLTPRAAAERAFAAAHAKVEKDHPYDKNQHDSGVNKQSPTRPGEKRASEPMKTLKDIRK